MTESKESLAKTLTREESDAVLAESIAKRREDFAAAMELPPYAVRLGASNMPGDPRIWSADWREQLPEGHIARVEAEKTGELPVAPQRSLEITRQAHLTLLESARRTGHAGP